MSTFDEQENAWLEAQTGLADLTKADLWMELMSAYSGTLDDRRTLWLFDQGYTKGGHSTRFSEFCRDMGWRG